MAVDGYLNFDTKINTKGFNSGTKQITSGISSLKSSLSKLGKTIAATFAVSKIIDFGKQAIEMASDLQEVQNVVDVSFGSMSSKMEEFAEKSIETYGISKLTAKQTGSTYMAMAKSMGIAEEAASDMSLTLTGLSADMASFYNKQQSITATALDSVFTGETETLKQFGIVMTEANLEAFALSKGITKSVSAMSQAEKVQLRYAYVMERTALAQGDFARTSDGWANQTRILSEQWKEFSGIIGQALVQIILPAVRMLNQAMGQLISVAKNAFNTLSELFGWEIESSGSSSAGIGKMNEALADSVENQEALTDAVNKTSKAYKNQLMSFDKINRLSDNNSAASVSLSAFEGLLGGQLGGTVNTKLTVDASQAKKEVFGFSEYFKKSLSNIKTWWNTNFSDIFGDVWEGLSGEAGEFVETVKSAFKDLASLEGSITSYFSGDFTTFLQTSFATAGDIVTGLFDTFNTVFSDIWNLAVFPVLESFIAYGLPVLTQFANNSVSSFRIFFNEVKEIFDELWTDAVQPVLAFISSLWDDLMQSISDTWEKWGEPIFDGIKTAITNTADIFKTFWDTTLKPIWNKFMETVDEVWNEHLKPFVDKFLDFVGTFVEGALEIYNEFIAPLIKWFAEKFGPAIAGVFNFITEIFGGTIGDIIDVAGSIIDSLKGIVNFVVGVFTGDWKKAWEGIKSFFKGIWDSLVGIVKTPINHIIDLINGLIRAIEGGLNWVISGLNSLSFTIPDWVPSVGGNTFGFNISQLDLPEIPRLATGTVVPANYGEFLAVLGDNKREPEIVSPESAIRKVVSEELNKHGGTDTINLTVELDGEVVYRKVVKRNKQNTKMTGVNALATA